MVWNLETKRRLLRYFELIEICRGINQENELKNIKRNVSVIQDVDGNNIVMINDIAFKGKRSVEWSDVEKCFRQYVGDIYRIAETEDIIYIGTDLPDEYSGSNYTKHIKGTIAKAKANAAQAIPEMIEIATQRPLKIIIKISTVDMQKMDGTVMTQDLQCRYMMKMEMLSDTIYSVRDY